MLADFFKFIRSLADNMVKGYFTKAVDKGWSTVTMDCKDIVVIADLKGEGETVLLQKMLQSCQIHLQDVTLLTPNQLQDLNLAALIRQYNIRYVFNFGFDVRPFLPNIENHPFQVLRCLQAVVFNMPTLAEIQPSQEYKKHIWQYLLKPHFSVA